MATDIEAIIAALPPEGGTNSLAQLNQFLLQNGLVCTARRASIEDLPRGPFPLILHLRDPDHFVVVSGVQRNRVHLFDSFGRRITVVLGSLEVRWSGYMLHVGRKRSKASIARVGGQPSPRIRFESLLVDKGDVPAVGAPVRFRYPFRNVGNANLTIRNTQLSCSCLEFNAPSEPVPPGGEAAIELVYRSRFISGPLYQEAIVETNDSLHPFIILKAAGFLDTGVKVVPSDLHLGRVLVGQSTVVPCFVKCPADPAGFVVEANSSLHNMDISVYSTASDAARKWWPEAGASYHAVPGTRVVELVFTPTRVGPIEGQLNIRTNVEGFEHMAVPVSATVDSAIVAWPGLLSFGEVVADEKVQEHIELVSLAGEPFQVLAVEPETPGLACSFSRDVIEEARLLRFETTGAVASQLSGGTVHVRLQIPGRGSDVRVPLPIFAHQKRSVGDE